MEKIDLTKAKDIAMDTRKKVTPIVVVAIILSAASLGWTTWSLLDLLKVGAIGLTVSVTADLIWASVIYCEYKGIGSSGWVKAIGWFAVLIVGGFIAWHGVTRENMAMAVAGPFLTIGTKAVWELALISIKDPTEITAEDQDKLDKQLRDINFEGRQKQIEARQTVASLQADSLKRIAEIKGAAQVRIAELESQQEVFEAQRAFEQRMEAMGSSYKLIRTDDYTAILDKQEEIPRASVPQAIPAPRPAPLAKPSGAITVRMDDALTPAQQELKKLAAAWYVAERQATAMGELLSKAKFAERIGVNKPQITRATQKFPLEDFTEAELSDLNQESA